MIKRPAMLMAIAFCTGITAALFIRQVFFIILFFFIIMLIYIYAARKKLPFTKNFLLIVIVFFCGYINYACQFTYLLSPMQDFYETTITMNGYITSQYEENNGKLTFDFHVDTLKTKNCEHIIQRNVRVTVYNFSPSEEISLGRYLVINGELRKPEGARNPGGFNFQNYLLSSKITGSVSVSGNSLIVKNTVKHLPLLIFGDNVQKRILQALDRNLTYEKSALMAAMLTGYREKLTTPMEDAFSASGLIHIMAVSGANIAFLLMPVLWLFRMLGINRRLCAAAAIPLIFIYVLITGMEASVLRASIMALVVLIGKILDRKADIINSLCVASIIILVINPFMLMDAGFQLSAGATAGLGILYKRIRNSIPEKTPDLISETLAATLAAQAGVLPMLILYFSRVSVVSLVANLLVVPLTGITTVTGMIVAIAGNISHQLSALVSYMLQALLHIILVITNAFGSIPWAELNMKHWGGFWICIYYMVLIIIGNSSPGFFTRHMKKVVVSSLILGIVMVSQGFIPETLKVSFIDVGQGDSALISAPGGSTMLIDGGGSYSELDTRYIGQNIIFPLLMHEKIPRLDYMMLTHADADHTYGAMTLMEILPVGKVLLPNYKGAAQDFSRLINLCQEKGTEVLFLSVGDTVNLGKETDFEVLYPDSSIDYYSSLNDTSLCGMLKYRKLQILFTGDMGKEGEEVFLRLNQNINCDILKTPHHGGKNGSSERFLNASSPKIAVISVGRNNYGHPSKEVLGRLSSVGAKIYATIDYGAIIIKSNGTKYKIKTWLRDEMFTFLN
jgi:competence protein ComEC